MLEDLIKDLREGIGESQTRRAIYDESEHGILGSALGAPVGGGGGRARGRLSNVSRGRGGNGGSIGGRLKGGNPSFADPQQVKNAMAIAQTGRRLGASRRDIITALATGFVESNLHNVHYGDLDSLGVFQQRNAWGSRRQRLNPHKSAAMFFKGGHAGQEGLFDIKNRDRLPIGVNAQDVQVSAYPGRYATRVDEARRLLDFITRGRSHKHAARRRLRNG